MFQRATRQYDSNAQSDKRQSPLRVNNTVANTAREPGNSQLKRKLERSLSYTSRLASLSQQNSFDDENTPPEVTYVDLTSPQKHSSISYPSLDNLDCESYPTLPPLSNNSTGQPPSSAPVPWSSSPPSHYNKPNAATRVEEPPSPVRPTKRRVLPASFTSADARNVSSFPTDTNASSYTRTSRERLTTDKEQELDRYSDRSAAAHQKKFRDPSHNVTSAMSAMLQQAPAARQRSSTPVSRPTTSSGRTLQSFMKPTDGQKLPLERLPEPFLSDEQKAVMKAVMEEGKSVFFTGSAGTGKSVLMRAIISQLKHKYRKEPDRYAITASTGLASCILEGQTLHSWSGIGLGKEPAPELVKKVKRNQKSRQKWLRTKILIIDEISMVDGQLFDKLEQVARTIRNNGRPFGGIQLVVTGDFFQLPPVPDKNSTAKFVFDAVTWNTCIQHTILLTHVFRQKDENFARMLNEMRLGKMSPATIREFKSLSRPLNFRDELEATELYPRREEVENANQNRMRKLSGQIMTFNAVDSGVQDLNVRKNLLANFIAPEVLELKKGAQVMLIKNIDSQLVNGSLGIVQSFMDEGTFFAYKEDEPTFLLAHEPDDGEHPEDKAAAREKIQAARLKSQGGNVASGRLWPMVRFNLPDGTSRSMLCAPDEWKTESQQGEVLAKRVQVPLILAWALSIHKAQGQTLSRVKVDLGKVFEKGQAYVALSRARSKEGLQVLRFDERKVMVHAKVLQFYSKLSGHTTLEKPFKTTGVEPTLFAKKDSVKSTAKTPVEEDEFGDDFSYEEMLELESQMMSAGSRGR